MSESVFNSNSEKPLAWVAPLLLAVLLAAVACLGPLPGWPGAVSLTLIWLLARAVWWVPVRAAWSGGVVKPRRRWAILLLLIVIGLLIWLLIRQWPAAWVSIKTTRGRASIPWIAPAIGALAMAYFIGQALFDSVQIWCKEPNQPCVFLAETPAAALFFLSCAGPERPDVWIASLVIAATAVALARAEGCPGKDAPFAQRCARLVLIALTILSWHQWAGARFFDARVEAVVGWQRDLELPATLAVTLLIMLGLFWLLLRFRCLLNRLHWFMLWQTARWSFAAEAHVAVRHVGHLVDRSLAASCARRLLRFCRWLLGRPATPQPPADADLHATRYGLYAVARMRDAALDLAALDRHLRAARLSGSKQPASKSLILAAREYARATLAVADHRYCPWCGGRSSDPDWPLVEQIVCTLLTGEPHIGALSKRLRTHLSRQLPGHTEAQQVIREFFKTAHTDDWRRGARHRVLDALATPPRPQEQPARNADRGAPPEQPATRALVRVLLASYRGVSDWQGLLESFRQIRVQCHYVFIEQDHLDAGEACWAQARQLGCGELAGWLCQEALAHFFQARACEHLDAADPSELNYVEQPSQKTPAALERV